VSASTVTFGFVIVIISYFWQQPSDNAPANVLLGLNQPLQMVQQG
jgi:hypothetical protein